MLFALFFLSRLYLLFLLYFFCRSLPTRIVLPSSYSTGDFFCTLRILFLPFTCSLSTPYTFFIFSLLRIFYFLFHWLLSPSYPASFHSFRLFSLTFSSLLFIRVSFSCTLSFLSIFCLPSLYASVLFIPFLFPSFYSSFSLFFAPTFPLLPPLYSTEFFFTLRILFFFLLCFFYFFIPFASFPFLPRFFLHFSPLFLYNIFSVLHIILVYFIVPF